MTGRIEHVEDLLIGVERKYLHNVFFGEGVSIVETLNYSRDCTHADLLEQMA